jgi:hypothetical protein
MKGFLFEFPAEIKDRSASLWPVAIPISVANRSRCSFWDKTRMVTRFLPAQVFFHNAVPCASTRIKAK